MAQEQQLEYIKDVDCCWYPANTIRTLPDPLGNSRRAVSARARCAARNAATAALMALEAVESLAPLERGDGQLEPA